MIQINVVWQLKQTVGVTRHYQISETVDETDYQIEGEVELLRTDRGILVTGTLETTIQVMCSRCLEAFNYPLTLKIEDEYFPTVDVVSGIPLSAPEGLFTIDENHEISLDEAVRQYTLLASPMKPLCRPDCKGLCPYCGFNLNHGTCGCLPPPDPRWAGLGKLVSGVAEGERRKD